LEELKDDVKVQTWLIFFRHLNKKNVDYWRKGGKLIADFDNDERIKIQFCSEKGDVFATALML
jgi:hypothetical protein